MLPGGHRASDCLVSLLCSCRRLHLSVPLPLVCDPAAVIRYLALWPDGGDENYTDPLFPAPVDFHPTRVEAEINKKSRAISGPAMFLPRKNAGTVAFRTAAPVFRISACRGR